MPRSGDIRAGGAFVEVYSKDGSLRKALDRASKKLKHFGKGVRALGKNSSS